VQRPAQGREHASNGLRQPEHSKKTWLSWLAWNWIDGYTTYFPLCGWRYGADCPEA